MKKNISVKIKFSFQVQIINGSEMQRALNLVLSVFYWKTFKTLNNFFFVSFLCLGGKSVPLKT